MFCRRWGLQEQARRRCVYLWMDLDLAEAERAAELVIQALEDN